MRTLLILLLLTAPAWAAPPDTHDLGFAQRPGAPVPLDLAFRDSDGAEIQLGALLHGRPAILILGYFRCPALCGLIRDDAFAALSQTGLATPGDFGVIDVSIDPADTPADAAAAKDQDMARFPTPGAAKGWHFLTGAPEAVARLSDAVGYRSRWDGALQQYLHPAGLVILGGDGHVASYALGMGYPAAELRGALLRARDGVVARAASPILLLCFHFDPSTGRYTLAILKVLQLAAALTVVTLGLVLWALHRGGRPA